MSKTELTKHLIAKTLKEQARYERVDKISISKIVETARLNRQTFYYHFQDKQDLVCWIFDTDISALTDKTQNGTLLDDVVEYLYSEKEFYVDALASNAQNSLREHMFEVFRSRIVNDILHIAGSRSMPPEAVNQLSRFFANGIAGSIVQWAKDGMQYENVCFLQTYAPFTKELLALAIKNIPYKTTPD